MKFKKEKNWRISGVPTWRKRGSILICSSALGNLVYCCASWWLHSSFQMSNVHIKKRELKLIKRYCCQIRGRKLYAIVWNLAAGEVVFLFCFLFLQLHPWHMEVPGSRIGSKLQVRPMPQLQQQGTLNPLHLEGMDSTPLQWPELLQSDS